VGDSPGSKAEKARDLGITIISEDDLNQMISGQTPSEEVLRNEL
jgi:BRCT domain type II-containing protein